MRLCGIKLINQTFIAERPKLVNQIKMERIWNKPKVFVAMSGGVDSSVAAALLKKRGFEVTGIFFKPWSSFKKTAEGQVSYCDWQKDREDAVRVASILKIGFETWDFSQDYGKKVTNYMIESYRRGLTPNPDIMCNKEIKFGLFLRKALARGADFIATGHYTRKRASLKFKVISYKLLKAKDKNKDQSYFLWTLTQKELKHSLFPIGDYTKPEVRKIAAKLGLPNHAKKDSQGICFIGQLDMKEFLRSYIEQKVGDIKLIDNGQVIGRHDGVYYYTIGQRHGLNITIGGGPYYVADKDMKNNIIYVARDYSCLMKGSLAVADINWISEQISLPLEVRVRMRYRDNLARVRVEKNGSGSSVVLKFSKPVGPAAPGQSAVFYKGSEVLGGGVII